MTARELPVRAGCYAEYIAVPERAPFALPDGADLEAAACLSNYQVAWHLLHTATRGAPGQSVLVGSASGGLGSAAVQLAKLAGMTAIALVGSAGKGAGAARRSAPTTSSTTAARISRRVSPSITTGDGVDLILDAVGGTDFAKFLPMLGPFGLLVSYGKLVGKIEGNVVDALDAGPGYLNSAAVRIFTMHTLDDKPAIRAQSMNDLIGKARRGVIRPLIHARLPLKDARRAHEMIEARQVIGKILLKPLGEPSLHRDKSRCLHHRAPALEIVLDRLDELLRRLECRLAGEFGEALLHRRGLRGLLHRRRSARCTTSAGAFAGRNTPSQDSTTTS